MKLVLKTITGKQHEVDVEPTATILDVKKLVEDDYEPASLRLCYNGAVLEDGKTLTEAGVKEGESLVLAGRKRKIPKPPAQPPAEALKAEPPAVSAEATTPASSTPAEANTEAKAEAEAKPTSPKETAAPSDAPADTTTSATAATTAATAAAAAEVPTAPVLPPSSSSPASASTAATVPVAPVAPALNTYGAPTNLIDEVCSMGFEDRNQVALALRAAYMNVDRAVEYLFDGIPPHLVQELTRDSAPVPPASAPSTSTTATTTTTTAPSTSAPATTTAAAGATATVPSAEAELRAALTGIPQFDEIRALYAQNTSTLPIVTQQIALRHPAVYELIERHPEAFLQIMSETGGPGSAEQSAPQSGSTTAPASTARGTTGEDEESGFMNQLPAELQVTAEDRVAVQQLVELGGGMWDEQGALLVYLATQRNQEVAASILFEHGGVPPELLAEIANQMAGEDDYEDEEGNGDEQQ